MRPRRRPRDLRERLMSSTPSSPLPYGPLFRTLFFFVIGALFVSLAGRHKATREMMSVANVAGTIKNDETAKVRGGLHELVIDQPTRDPAAPSAHASTHVHLSDGGYLVAWFGGTREGAGDVAIWSARRKKKGGRGGAGEGEGSVWSMPTVVAKQSDEAHWNPVLFFVDDVLHLHFKVGDDIDTWRTYAATSTDEGETWTDARELVPGDIGGRGCVKNKPLVIPSPSNPNPNPTRTRKKKKIDDGEKIQKAKKKKEDSSDSSDEEGGGNTAAMDDDTPPVLLCGASTESGGWRAFIDVSTDGGNTWVRTPDIHVSFLAHYPDVGIIQPSLWRNPSKPDIVHAVFRSDAGAVYRADATDGGRTWGPAMRTKLTSSNTGVDVAAMLGGKLLALAYNPGTADGSNWGRRYPLRVSLSADDGLTWSHHVDLETTPGEYSYPALTPWPEDNDGMGAKGFTLTYTYNRQNVKFISMGIEEFLRRAAAQKQTPSTTKKTDDP